VPDGPDGEALFGARAGAAARAGELRTLRIVREGLLEADRLACALGRARNRLSVPLARAAEAFVRVEAWRPFGHARLADHARERFGRSGRWVHDLAGLGRSLESLPDLARSLCGDDGGRPIGRVAALLIGGKRSPDRVRRTSR